MGALAVGERVVGCPVVGSVIAGALDVGARVVGSAIAGDLVVGARVVGTTPVPVGAAVGASVVVAGIQQISAAISWT
jgi:hypothetical protein